MGKGAGGWTELETGQVRLNNFQRQNNEVNHSWHLYGTLQTVNSFTNLSFNIQN